MIRYASATLLATATLLTPHHALAQDPLNRWTGDLELGYVSTQGNSEATTINGKAEARRESDLWRYVANFNSLNSSEDDERSAERYFLSNKLDYKFGDRSYVFAYASYDDDRFSGFDWQAVVASGYGYRILDSGVMLWDAEVGPGYRVNKVEEPFDDYEREVILRGHTRFRWNLSDTATFEQELSVESGNENTISRSVTSLKTTIIGQLAMKLSYTVKYTDEVPLGTERTDRETAVTVVYSF